MALSFSYEGGILKPGSLWTDPTKSVSPGEQKEVMRFSRQSDLESYKSYVFKTKVILPENNWVTLAQKVSVETSSLTTGSVKSSIWAAIITPRNQQLEPNWSTDESVKIVKTWEASGKKFIASFVWSDYINEDVYHDLFYEISVEE